MKLPKGKTSSLFPSPQELKSSLFSGRKRDNEQEDQEEQRSPSLFPSPQELRKRIGGFSFGGSVEEQVSQSTASAPSPFLSETSGKKAPSPFELRKQAQQSRSQGDSLTRFAKWANPLRKVKVRPALNREEQEIYGGGIGAGVVNLGSRILEDIIVGGIKGFATAKKASADLKGKEFNPVELPYAISYQRAFEDDVVTQKTFEDMGTSALKRIEKLDQERPQKSKLNVVQGATEEIFFPLLDAVDILGIGSLVGRGARSAVTKPAAREALNKLGIGFLGDFSDDGIKTAAKQKTDDIIKRAADGKIGEEKAIQELNEVGDALDELTGDNFRFGNIGERIYNTTLEAYKNRGAGEIAEFLGRTPRRVGLSVDDVGDEAIARRARAATQGDQSDTVIQLGDRFSRISDDVAQAINDEVGKIPFSAGDEVHLSQFARVQGKLDEVPLDDLLKDSPNVRTTIDNALTELGRLPDDTALGARTAGENVRDVAARGDEVGKSVVAEKLQPLAKEIQQFEDVDSFLKSVVDEEEFSGESLKSKGIRVSLPLDSSSKTGGFRTTDPLSFGKTTASGQRGKPITVVFDVGTGDRWVLDGNTRIREALQRGEDSINANVNFVRSTGSPTSPNLVALTKDELTDVFEDVARSTSRRGTIPLRNEKGQFQDSVSLNSLEKETKEAITPEPFEGLEGLTLASLEQLKGKTNISRQFISDLTNQGGIKQAERDILRSTLEEFDGDKVNAKEFAEKVQQRLLPLESKTTREGKYETVSLADDRGQVQNYVERIYESPIPTSAGSVHFNSDEFPNYFAHTRVEYLPNNTARVIEVQSDLFQRGRLEEELKISGSGLIPEDRRANSALIAEANRIRARRQEAGESLQQITSNPTAREKEIQDALDASEGKSTKAKELLVRDRAEEIKPLEPYKNIWHERIIREEIKGMARRGQKSVLFPTGETAMKIEGLAESGVWIDESSNLLKPDDLGFGKKIVDSRTDENWYITNVAGDDQGNFVAVPEREVWGKGGEELADEDFYELLNYSGNWKMFEDDSVLTRVMRDIFENDVEADELFGKYDIEDLKIRYKESYLKSDPENAEAFSLGSRMDTDNPIYRFYEKDVQKYLNKKYGAKRITDSEDVEWFEVQIKPAFAHQPVEAFGAAAGIEIDSDGNVGFDPVRALFGVAAVGLGAKAFGQDPLRASKNLSKQIERFETADEFVSEFSRIYRENGIRAFEDPFMKTPRATAEEQELMQAVFDYTSTPEVLQRYKDGANDSEILGDFFKHNKSEEAMENSIRDAQELVDEAIKTQRRTSGTEPKGFTTASTKLDGVPNIPNTPSKAARYAMKNPDTPLEIPDETRAAFLQRKIQDKFNRVNLVQKEIAKKKGVPLSDDLNAYLQQEMFHGRAAERIDKFENTIISSKGQKGEKALLERMTDDGIGLDEMGEFLHARHAPARNRRVAELTKDSKKPLTDGGSGMTNKKAAEVMEKYRQSGKAEKMEAYAKEIKEKVIDERLKILETEHLLKPEAVENIARAFDDDTYVPLKLADKPDIRMRGGKGFDTRGKDVKRLKGSTEAKRTNPLVQAIMDYEDAVIKAEKNKVGRTMKQLIEENPNVVDKQGNKLWSIKAQQYTPVYNKFGEVEYVKPVGFKLDDNVMEVRDKGKIFHITFEDPAIASAMKNLGTERGVKFLHTINNYLRSVITFYNPEFLITNFERDVQMALINVAGEQGSRHAANIAKDIKPALQGIWRNTRGKAPKVTKKGVDWSSEYQELKEVGGRVGWFDYKTVAEKQEQIQKRINRAAGKSKLDKAARTWDGVAEFVSDMNESVESGVRLAAYVNAKRAGMSKEQAASLAKNLTVNFNKKGEWGTAVNSLYLFANAAIQGTARIFTSLKHPRTRRIVAGIAASAYGLEYMNRQINEEAYEKIGEYEKNTNYVFVLPAGVPAPTFDSAIGDVKTIPDTNEKYITIKLPYGYNFFKVMGDVAYEMTLGDERVGDSIKRLLLAADESFNPLSSGTVSQLVSPTVTDPIVQMWENRNFFGGKIRPDQPAYQAEKKDSSLYFKTVRKPTKAFTSWMNDITGGNEVEAGLVDLSPENVDHLIDFIGGGVGKFFANTLETGVSLGRGELPDVDNTPFVRKFIGEVYEDVEMHLFYDVIEKSETRLLNKYEHEKLKKYGKQARQEGQIDDEAIERAVTNMLKNQNRIHAARVLEMTDTVNTVEERRRIFDHYIADNDIEKWREEVLKQLSDIVEERDKGKPPEFSQRESSDSVVDAVFTYAKAIGTDPADAFDKIFSNQRIRKVEGGAVIIERNTGTFGEDTGFSTEVRREFDAGDEVRLDHTIPVQLGGSDTRDNVRLVPVDEWKSYTPVENHLGSLMRNGRISQKEAQDMIVDFKEGRMSAEEILQLR